MEINSYTSAMERIAVTPALRERVLDGALAHPARRKPHIPSVALAACCLLLVALAMFSQYLPGMEGSDVMVGNPMHKSENVAQLKKDAPFPLWAPGVLPEGYTVDGAGLIAGMLAQIRYAGPAGEITFRMAEGSDDVSGDYRQYTDIVEENMGAYVVTVKGDGGTVSLCTWSYGENTYALSFAQPTTAETARAVIAGVAPVQ